MRVHPIDPEEFVEKPRPRSAAAEGSRNRPPPETPFPLRGAGGLRALLAQRYHGFVTRRRWARLRSLGMHIGANVNLPASVWVDTSHCHLISIGDECGFGEGVCILAHDALANQFLDATRIGRVVIRESCHIGARAVILPGVEIGPRSIVGANSVVTRSIPPGSVAAGNPARVLCTLEEYLARQRARLRRAPKFPFEQSDVRRMSPEERRKMFAALADGDGFIVGGYAAQRDGRTDQQVTD
ncbi:MAG TPA: acyltransferase [Myxococcales bacterium]|jgi:maltose O-acetyltransferase